jgi:hypothetical protein
MLATIPASMLNQSRPDLGVQNRFRLNPSPSRSLLDVSQAGVIPDMTPALKCLEALLNQAKDFLLRQIATLKKMAKGEG